MNYNIASVLKQLRKASRLSPNDVTQQLKEYEITISTKTLYGYENGQSMPNANVFIALCKIYKCNNPMELFGNTSFTCDDIYFLERFKELDTQGQKTTLSIMENELKRIKQINQLKSRIENVKTETSKELIPTRLINYYYRLASAGSGQIVFDMPPTKRIEIPNTPEYRKVDYAIGVNGNSMEPVYHDGDTLLIEMAEEIEIGETGIFLVDGESYVKKLGDGELISLNPNYGNITLTENSKCMGKVIGKFMN